MNQNDSDVKEKLLRIKMRKQQRDRVLKIKISVLVALCLLFVFLVVSAVSSLVDYVKTLKPKEPKPPVNLMSYIEPIPEVEPEKEASYVYVEPVPTPYKQASQETDFIAGLAGSRQKVCYLTFDDGPSISITPQILDVLRRYDVRATFFQVGVLIESNPDIARQVFEEGHLIANHSYSHNYKEIYSSGDAFMTDVLKTEELIKGVLGSEEEFYPLVRFPGGSYNAGSYKDVKQSIKSVLGESGYVFCDWNALNGDSEGAKKNADQLFEYFKKSVNLEKPVVVLMHDAANKQSTVDSLDNIIEYMMNAGYTFLRLDEVL